MEFKNKNSCHKIKPGALKHTAEDMSSLLSSHALQAADTREDHNDTKQLTFDQSDNIDGKFFTKIFFIYFILYKIYIIFF